MYDRSADVSHSVEYADIIADLYRFLWDQTQDLGIRRLLLTRMILTGKYHNRFHVGDVVEELLAGLTGPTEVALAAEVIDNNQRAAAWYASAALKRPLRRQPIADALRRAQQAVAAA